MHEGIQADVMIVGKALAAVSIIRMLASKEILCVFKPGDHGFAVRACFFVQ
jgi:acetylornithine/succinyldiaminopimelate/putrescine aminotransferase